jgi:hypothetical protein
MLLIRSTRLLEIFTPESCLAYHGDPGLEAGEFFPLWTIQ